MKKILLIVTLLGLQLSTSFAQQLQATDPRIVEVYGTYAQQLTPEQLAWEQTKLDRTQVIVMPVVTGEAFPKLSSLTVITKYVPSLTMETQFNPATINTLKYAINYMNTKEDQIFRIDNTEYVIVIAKKN